MKLIAHRGNANGPNSSKENKPDHIEESISQGYDVEIDVRYDSEEKKFYLGHDEPQYEVNLNWFNNYIDKLWIHCKNIEALYEFSYRTIGFNYFWHQEDDFTLTSKNYIWTYPGKPYTSRSVIVMPENNFNLIDLIKIREYDVYGVCTDYPNLI